MENSLSPSYQKTLDALSENDLGRALILARNGLKEAELREDALNQCAHQGLFARIHMRDEDRDSARRALKLMKLHLEKLQGESRRWGEEELTRLSSRLNAQ